MDRQRAPKYLNSPGPSCSTRRELYGLFEARQATRSPAALMVVEGYMDVVSLHQAGVTYAVATLAPPPARPPAAHLPAGRRGRVLLRRRPGRAAPRAWRALETGRGVKAGPARVRFLFLPEATTPTRGAGGEGAAAFEARLATPCPSSDYLIRELSGRTDVGSWTAGPSCGTRPPLVNRSRSTSIASCRHATGPR